MPYDPYAQANPWWQQQGPPQQGVQFAAPPPPQQKKEWWQGVPMPKSQTGQSANSPNGQSGQPSPGLLQMLMMGGKPTYSGTPTAGAAPSAGGMNMGASPWGWLGGMFGSPSTGPR